MSKNLGGLGGGLGWGGERGATAWSNPALGNQLSSSPTSGLLPDSIQVLNFILFCRDVFSPFLTYPP